MAEPFNTPAGPTPVPGATPVGTTPRSATPIPEEKPIVLHIGDIVRYNPETYAEFERRFTVVRPHRAERQRPDFIRGLREGRWGDFAAIFRPFWGSGGEMGRWDKELIDLLPASCRVFASAGAGFDWADTKLLGERGIVYCNSGLAAAEAVSDFAVAMIISTFRHLAWCIAAGSSGDPAAFRISHNLATGLSHNLRGQVLGLIGMGNIGQNIAAKMGSVAFGMKIHYYDVVRKPQLEEGLNATYHDTLEGLLGVSDCVVLCTPASVDGKPLLSRTTIAQMKEGARFVNVARGSLVDEEALADALEDEETREPRVSEELDIVGRLSAAAIDVHADEPNVHPRLLKLASLSATTKDGHFSAVPARLMLTCHNAGGTVETHVGFEELSMRNIMAVLGGEPALTAVNLHHMKE